MTAVLRKSLALLALSLAIALPAGAAEREGPVGPILSKAVLPGLEAVPASIVPNAALPTLPQLPVGTPEIAAPEGAAAAPQAQTTGPQAIPAQTERTGEILQQLDPKNAANVGSEQASALAASLLDPSIKVSAGAEAVPAAQGKDSKDELAPWERAHADAKTPVPEGGYEPSPTRPTVSEWLHYQSLWYQNIWFYIYTNIRNKWGPYLGYWQKLRDSGVPPIVSKPREFFAAMRIFGQTGYFYVPGFTPMEDADVLTEARQAFHKYFDGPGIGDKERASFDGFTERALLFNNKRRAASKFRANVRDNMLKASTMTPDKIAGFFEALPIQAKTDDFQKNAADAILAQFKEVALSAIAEEPKDAKDRVTGVILIGSFALGAATPKSDFDIEPITADGGSGRVRAFADKVAKRWAEAGRQQTNPVSFHYFGYLNSRWEIRAIHHEPYIIISPDQSIIDNLAMRPGEPPSHNPSRKKTAMGQVLRGLQYAAVYATSLITPAKVPEKL